MLSEPKDASLERIFIVIPKHKHAHFLPVKQFRVTQATIRFALSLSQRFITTGVYSPFFTFSAVFRNRYTVPMISDYSVYVV